MPHPTNKCLISFGSLFKLTAVVQKSPKVSITVCILKQSNGLRVFCGSKVVIFHFGLQRNWSIALCLNTPYSNTKPFSRHLSQEEQKMETLVIPHLFTLQASTNLRGWQRPWEAGPSQRGRKRSDVSQGLGLEGELALSHRKASEALPLRLCPLT